MMTETEIKALFKPHPILDVEWPALSLAQVEALVKQPDGDKLFADYVAEREQRLKAAAEDPLNRGFELGHWPEVRHQFKMKDMLFALGGNGAAKTELGGKLAAEKLVSGSGIRVLCVARNDDDSKTIQQAGVYKYLPRAARDYNNRPKKTRTAVLKINYSQGGGFTEGTFVLPNKSQCWFKTVAQYLRDPLSFEGPEYDLVWIDEGAPVTLVDTLKVRVDKRSGKTLFTFTAVHGIDAVCMRELEGARIMKTLPMQWDWLMNEGKGGVNPAITFPELKLNDEHVKGCPRGHMPFVMQPMNFSHGIVFMWTHWNPFLPKSTINPSVPKVFDGQTGRAKWQVRVRLFGWVEKLRGAAVGNFNPTVHVIPHAKIEAMLKAGKLTTYMAMDPAGSRSAFIVWKGVDAEGIEYIFDESPTVEEGEWVSADGMPGDGQNVYAGAGVKFYKRHIRERERQHGQEAERRFGDPRAFATQAAADDGGITLFELYAKDGREGSPSPPGEGEERADDLAPMYFEPAKIRQTPGLDVELIVDKLAYNTEEEISVVDQPKLYISDRCKNTIRCWLNWDGRPKAENGRDNPWKDGVDASRYLFCEDTPHIDLNIPQSVGGGGWG